MSVQPTVAAHYNQIEQRHKSTRVLSEIKGVKFFNNWVKSVLIAAFTPPRATVLDLCCGKGGDLRKYVLADVWRYVGVDHAHQSLKHAIERLNESPHFLSDFVCCDCHRAELARSLPPDVTCFDVVSCQFALHYAFETEQTARQFVRNLACRLKPGGHFIATFPNSNVLLARLHASLLSTGSYSFGNSIYRVRFTEPCPLTLVASNVNSRSQHHAHASDSQQNAPFIPFNSSLTSPASPFGIEYYFDLKDAISDCPEYLVDLPTLCSLAAEYDLELLLDDSLHSFFQQHYTHPQCNRLLTQMKVIKDSVDREDVEGSAITQEEWDVLYVYEAVVFRRCAPSSSSSVDDGRDACAEREAHGGSGGCVTLPPSTSCSQVLCIEQHYHAYTHQHPNLNTAPLTYHTKFSQSSPQDKPKARKLDAETDIKVVTL